MDRVLRPLLVCLLVAAMAATAPPAQAAAPRYITVSGPPLERLVVLAAWRQNLDVLLAIAHAPRATGEQAPVRGAVRLRLGLFWRRSPEPRPTDDRAADQHGWFFPATRNRPAVVLLRADGRRLPRVAPKVFLRALAQRGVPVRLDRAGG
jgi:hypothetical protein